MAAPMTPREPLASDLSGRPAAGAARRAGLLRRAGVPVVAASVVLASLTGLTACTSASSPSPTQSQSSPPSNVAAADTVVSSVVSALQKGDVSSLPFTTGTPAAAVQADYKVIMGGMDGLLPTVTADGLTYAGSEAHATLHQTLVLGAAGTQKYTWTSTLPLQWDGSAWRVVWSPSIVHPSLTAATRLRHVRTVPARASIIGFDGKALAKLGEVWQVGIDKHLTTAAQALVDAKTLAGLLKVDAAAFVAKVKAAGTDAFVSAITLRPDAVPESFSTVKSARAVQTSTMLSTTSTFAQALLGSMGAPSTQQVAASHGDVMAEDQVGVSGLEKRYDAQLRGTVGHTIELVVRTTPSTLGTASASGSASADSGASDAEATTSPSGPTSPGQSSTLFTVKPVPGKALQLTLDATLQTKAETVLSTQKGVASVVVLDRATGGVRVAANSPASNANPDATYGQYAPGSTFKVISSLALIRQGFTPSTLVDCPATITINGKSFHNYSEFPSSMVGRISLAAAVANSCNTAFLGQYQRFGGSTLATAAASPGVGRDYDAGFTSFYGSVPAASDPVTQAADSIGQGQVVASPLAMAGVAASVGAGHTVIPYLVTGTAPKSTGTPLTAAEASQLQTLMRGVVTAGSGRGLAGIAIGAKSGTAEFTENGTLKTHAWMIAYTQKYAVAVMVYDGVSGSVSAAPIIKSLLG